MSNTYPSDARKGILDRDGGIDGGNWTLRLYRSLAVPIGQDLTLADITEADYSGYAPIVSTAWGGATLNTDGMALKTSPILSFVHDGGPSGNNIPGWYLTWDVPGPSALVSIQAFPTIRGMFGLFDLIEFSVIIAVRQGV